MTPPTLVVLAAGMGSRYGGLKQIDPMGPNGEVLLDYALFDAWRSGFTRVVFVIKPEMETAFRERFGGQLAGRLAVGYAFQTLGDLPGGQTLPADRIKPWGTGHATWAARDAVTGRFAVINADDFYGEAGYRALAAFFAGGDRGGSAREAARCAVVRGPESPALPVGPGFPARGHAAETSLYAMVAFRLGNTLSPHGTVARGICETDPEGFLTDVVECTRIGATPEGNGVCESPSGGRREILADTPVSMNMWGLDDSVFPRLGRLFGTFLEAKATDAEAEFYLPSAVGALIAAGDCRVRALSTADRWFGVTYPDDKPTVQASIRELVTGGAYPERLWE